MSCWYSPADERQTQKKVEALERQVANLSSDFREALTLIRDMKEELSQIHAEVAPKQLGKNSKLPTQKAF